MTQLATLVAELAGVAVVTFGSIVVMRRRGTTVRSPVIAAVVLSAVLCLSILLHLRGAGSVLNQARERGVSSAAGLEHCLSESLTGQPVIAQRTAFLKWVRRRLPPDAIYAVSPYSGPPDLWCVTLVLLPALPAGPGGQPHWTIYAAGIPAAVRAAIARRSPDVLVFAPGYALVRGLTG